MKISKKYEKVLANYLVWSKCTTPFSNNHWGKEATSVYCCEDSAGVNAEEALFRFETHGDSSFFLHCNNTHLLQQYYKGKANRDFWTKERGWFRKFGFWIAEEWCNHLLPECFCELEGHWPRPHLVRWFYDNEYTEAMLTRDQERRLRGIELVQGGIEII